MQHRTDDADRWITNELDPWILAAAHAGDLRAMRFAARRERYRPSDVYKRLSSRVDDRAEEFGLPYYGDVFRRAHEAGRRERAFWCAKAAEYGDAESIAAWLKEMGPEHQEQHLHHLMAIAKYSVGSTEGFRVPGRIDLFLATYPVAMTEDPPLRDLQELWDSAMREAGARDGCEPCMKSLELPLHSRSDDELDQLGNRAVSALLWSDAEWVATVTDMIPPYGHRMRHLLRLLAAARYEPDSPGPGAYRRLPGWWGIDWCQAGAGAPFDRERCAERWADYQRHLGPDDEAELQLWQERAAQELRERLPPSPPPRFGGGPSTAETIVTTAVITSVLVPFVQALVTKAAEDSYKGLRQYLRTCFGQGMASHETPDRDDQLLVIRSPEGQQPDAVLQIWTDLPDEAISAFSQLLYDLRSAQPQRSGAARRWFWNGTARRWEVLQLPEPGPGGTPDDAT